MTRLFLVAGEASGDLHGGLLVRALRALDPAIEVSGIGGASMEEAGVRLIHRCDEMAVTGFWEVLRHLPRLRRILEHTVDVLRRDPPDALVPIDYPDFNLRLAARAAAHRIPIVYYISPQVWAWRSSRVKTLARLVRRMIVIFPFEEALYREAGIPVTYVGHPLVEQVRPRHDRATVRERLGLSPQEQMIVLLPGSRASEVSRILPCFLGARRILRPQTGIRWVLALAPGLPRAEAQRWLDETDGVVVREGETYELLAAADLALTASGTATLEAALLGAPMIVVYRMHPLTWALARRIVRVPHIAMANILAGTRLVPELLQGNATPEHLAAEVTRLLADPGLRSATSERLRAVSASLGAPGAPGRAARAILEEVAKDRFA